MLSLSCKCGLKEYIFNSRQSKFKDKFCYLKIKTGLQLRFLAYFKCEQNMKKDIPFLKFVAFYLKFVPYLFVLKAVLLLRQEGRKIKKAVMQKNIRRFKDEEKEKSELLAKCVAL